MEKLKDLIEQYEQSIMGKEDILIKAKLRMIHSLTEEISRSDDRIILDEIIGNFVAIIEMQRDMIFDQYIMMAQEDKPSAPLHCFVPAAAPQTGDFTDDKQLQNAFSAYLAGTERSSYTINDYCSRLRKAWNSFCEDQQSEEYRELCQKQGELLPDSPLLNAYHHCELLKRYITGLMATSDEKRNLANMRAAVNKLVAFKRNGQ